MYRVLMVCTGNICRSPVAEGLLRDYLPEPLKSEIDVSSAGTQALHGNQADKNAILAMEQIGIDITGHRARQVTREIARGSDLILTMEAEHTQIVKGLLKWGEHPRRISEYHPSEPIHDIADPYGRPVQAFEQCIRTLHPCIDGVIKWLGENV